MAKYSLTKKAVEDLENIWNYTLNEWSEEQADKYYLELIEGCEYLASNPNFGKNYEKIDLDIFGYLVNMHIIFFQKIKVDEILVVRILHASSDLKNRILE